MESIACIVGGLGLIACGLGLFRVRAPNWQDDGELAEEERRAIERWSKVQRIVRYLNNSLLMAIGASIAATAFIPHGRRWALAWVAIFVALLVCILLASIDAFSSLAGYRRALPEAARRSFQDR